MKDRIVKLLNIFMWVVIVFFVGDTILRIWEHVKMPEAAAAQSAPWYTDIIFFGIATVCCWVTKTCTMFPGRSGGRNCRRSCGCGKT